MADIRAVVFDAVGTLIHPSPGVAEAYAATGQKHGSRLSLEEVADRFRAAFRRQESIDRDAGWVTDEAREVRRWREIVAETLPDADTVACFAELYEHFARPDAWVADVSARFVLDATRRRRLTVAIASNFDHRLHGIVAGTTELAAIDMIVVSSEVGARKPSPAFFAAIMNRLRIPANQIAFVGDDAINDGQGAADAGMHPILLGRDVKSLADVAGIQWRLR